MMEEPVFDILRTKEQLGYDVYPTLRDTFGILGFSVTVNCQAGKHRYFQAVAVLVYLSGIQSTKVVIFLLPCITVFIVVIYCIPCYVMSCHAME